MRHLTSRLAFSPQRQREGFQRIFARVRGFKVRQPDWSWDRAPARLTCCLLLAIMLTGLQEAVAQAVDGKTPDVVVDRESTLVIGRVSDDPKKHFPRMMKFGAYLAQRLSAHGVFAADVIIAPSPEALTLYLQEGRVDLVSETPFGAIRFIDEAGTEPLVREWKKGAAVYRSVLIKRKDHDVTTLSDLKGQKIVFEDAGSTSAYLLPAAILSQHGLELVPLVSIFDDVPKGKVGYLFGGSESGVVSNVVRGVADVGALSNLEWDAFARTPDGPRQKLEVFYVSEPILRSVILVRSGMDGELKQEIKRLLLNMNLDEPGRAAMKSFNRATRHDELDQEALDSLSRVRTLVPLLPRTPQ